MAIVETTLRNSTWSRKLLWSFEVSVYSNIHHVLVHRPLAITFRDFQMRSSKARIDEDLIKFIPRGVLRAVDLLRSEVNVIHTNVNSDNLLYESNDEGSY